MPDYATQFLIEQRHEIWNGFITLVASAAGAYVTVLMRTIDGQEMTKREVWATFFIGIVMAIGFSSVVGQIIGVSFVKTTWIGGSSILSGMLGVRMAKFLMKLPIDMNSKENK